MFLEFFNMKENIEMTDFSYPSTSTLNKTLVTNLSWSTQENGKFIFKIKLSLLI